MSHSDSSRPTTASVSVRRRAFAVHLLTALGAAVALMALLEAVREHWTAMFVWFGVALIIDAIDGPLARRFEVVRQLPDWSGETLDLVVDFVTYVFVPAYAITASGLLMPLVAPFFGGAIVITGALYFADRRMKAADNHFRGFPTLWNVVAFYLFLLKPEPLLSSLIVLVLLVLTFVPFHVIHPIRVTRLRSLNLMLMALWGCLAIWAIIDDFLVPKGLSVALCAIAVYVLTSDLAIRFATFVKNSSLSKANQPRKTG